MGFEERYRDRQSLRSDFSNELLLSMARLGRLSKLQLGEKNPFFRHGQVEGEVTVPKEFSEIFSISPDVEADVIYLGDHSEGVTSGKWHFQVHIFTGLDIPGVRIFYESGFGITDLEFDAGNRIYGSDVPSEYRTFDKLVDLLKSGERSLVDFILKNGRLSKDQRAWLERYGLE